MAEALSPEKQIAALRVEVAQCHAVIAGLTAERDASQAELAEAAISKARLTTALLEIEHMKVQLAVLRRQRYGQSSEKLDRDIAQLEMRLEDLEENLGEQIAGSPKPVDPERQSEPKPHRKPAGRKPLPAHLPREVVVHEPEIACICGSCDPARLAKLGETTTEVLEKVPATLKVIRHVRPKYACRLCEKIFQAPAPELPIEKGRPGPRLLAHIAVSKYCDGIPLYRQSVILAREGVDIDRATMAEWMGHVAWWVRPLAERIGQYVMMQSVIWTDDTPIRTLAPGAGKTCLSRFWCYVVDPRPYKGPGHPAAFYRYSADRKGERPRGHLEGFSGYLHADAFAGYEALYRSNGQHPPRITHVACMAHAVRGVRDHEVLHRRGGIAAHPGTLRDRGRHQGQDRRSAPRGATRSEQAAARCISHLGRSAATAALRQGAARQGIPVRAQSLGRPDPLCRRRPAQHRQQLGRAAAAGHRGVTQEFSVPGFRSRRRPGGNHLHHHRNGETERPRSGGLSRDSARPPGPWSSHQPARRAPALELPATNGGGGLIVTASMLPVCRTASRTSARSPPDPHR